METKEGEIFEYNGEWYQCIVENGCENCAFNERKYYTIVDECGADRRKDNKNVIFKKLEKVGEPFYSKYYGKFYQMYKTYIPAVGSNFKIRVTPVEYVGRNEIFIEIKQTNEDMEEKNNGNTPLNVLTDKYVNGDICYDDFEKEVKALYSCKEGIKPTLKEFDLEAAKSGKPVCTRDGRKARIICFDRIDNTGLDLPIVALIQCEETEILQLYREDGKRNVKVDLALDLMMLPEKKEGWVNVYKGGLLDTKAYDTKKDAFDKASPKDYIATVKIEWEE